MTKTQLLIRLIDELDDWTETQHRDGRFNRDAWKDLKSFVTDLYGAAKGTHANITDKE